MIEPQQQAKHPVSLMAGPYGHPFHPILVTIPIGAWTASLVFDIASHVTTGPGFLAQGSLWLIVIGLIGALAWAAFVILLPVALLGFTMFFRWIGVYRATPAAASTDVVPAERHLPVPVVLAHGALAATTLVLVLPAAIGV
jgi:uncharacterized membrane protein